MSPLQDAAFFPYQPMGTSVSTALLMSASDTSSSFFLLSQFQYYYLPVPQNTCQPTPKYWFFVRFFLSMKIMTSLKIQPFREGKYLVFSLTLDNGNPPLSFVLSPSARIIVFHTLEGVTGHFGARVAFHHPIQG